MTPVFMVPRGQNLTWEILSTASDKQTSDSWCVMAFPCGIYFWELEGAKS